MGFLCLAAVALKSASMPIIPQSLLRLIVHCVKYSRSLIATGAKLNVSKSHGLLVGTWAHHIDLPIALDWSAEHIVIMGSRLSNASAPTEWDSHLSTLDSVYTSWKTRALSFHGLALIANALGFSTFRYFASFRCLPDTVVSAIKQRLFPFFWQKKREWLARSSLTQPLVAVVWPLSMCFAKSNLYTFCGSVALLRTPTSLGSIFTGTILTRLLPDGA